MKGKTRFQVWWPMLDNNLEEHTKHGVGCPENRCKDAEIPVFPFPQQLV